MRLAIQKLVLRDLGIRSKNKCAFPGCDHPILTETGEYIAELCHIEAAEPGGERYNPEQSDEERRAYDNLLFLCHGHHVATNDVDSYPVARMRELKAKHESLPEVVFNHSLLLVKLEEVLSEQAKLSEFIKQQPSGPIVAGAYPIHSSWVQDAWTPQNGRFYESPSADATHFKLMERNGWLHVEQRLQDGAVAYYEINEQGTVRNSRFPYPINEYKVEIPASLVLSQETVPPSVGDRAIRTVLKWSAGSVVEHFLGNRFVGADCNARISVDHSKRLISVLVPKNA